MNKIKYKITVQKLEVIEYYETDTCYYEGDKKITYSQYKADNPTYSKRQEKTGKELSRNESEDIYEQVVDSFINLQGIIQAVNNRSYLNDYEEQKKVIVAFNNIENK